MDAKKMVESIALILSYLKWAWQILLHASFFHAHYSGLLLLLLQYPRGGAEDDDEEEEAAAECAVCLSKIEEGDEVPELTCHHLFHKVCLDRWSDQQSFVFTRRHRRRPTCPLCRRSLAPSGPDVLVFDYASLVCSDDDDARQTWWLR